MLELLVVIAIVGLLASIILASLQSARFKGLDAAIKENLHSARNEAELYYSTNGNYGSVYAVGACPGSGATMFYADVNMRNAIASAQSASGVAPTCATSGTVPTSQWAISVPLKYAAGYYWCVDYTGIARSSLLVLSTAACP